jgi:outer membrane biosynthesis protein TonB
MRSFIIAVMVTIALAAAFVGNVHAVGLYAVGKEQCNCSPLIARGIIPDPLNKLHEALLFPQLAMILDKIAVGIKDMVSQVGMPPTAAFEEAIKKGEEASELKEKPAIEKKPGKEEVSPKEEKPAIEKKSIKKKKPAMELKKDQKKKRRVKIPPKVT